jgi:hypothetical protein
VPRIYSGINSKKSPALERIAAELVYFKVLSRHSMLFTYKEPSFNTSVGAISRILHYQTEESVKVRELELLKEIMCKYNAPRRSGGERIKLWRKSDILKCLTPPDALWGFTKVRDNGERDLVIKTINEMSIAAPRLTWVLYDENGSSESREILVRDGKIINGANIGEDLELAIVT